MEWQVARKDANVAAKVAQVVSLERRVMEMEGAASLMLATIRKHDWELFEAERTGYCAEEALRASDSQSCTSAV